VSTQKQRELVNLAQLSRRWDVSYTLLHRLVREGSIVPDYQVGRFAFFKASNLNLLAQEVSKHLSPAQARQLSPRALSFIHCGVGALVRERAGCEVL
jgi:hypothetical protein